MQKVSQNGGRSGYDSGDGLWLLIRETLNTGGSSVRGRAPRNERGSVHHISGHHPSARLWARSVESRVVGLVGVEFRIVVIVQVDKQSKLVGKAIETKQRVDAARRKPDCHESVCRGTHCLRAELGERLDVSGSIGQLEDGRRDKVAHLVIRALAEQDFRISAAHSVFELVCERLVAREVGYVPVARWRQEPGNQGGVVSERNACDVWHKLVVVGRVFVDFAVHVVVLLVTARLDSRIRNECRRIIDARCCLRPIGHDAKRRVVHHALWDNCHWANRYPV